MSPTVAHLAQKPGARFTLTCGPCRDSFTWTGPELVAKVGTEETFEALKARSICRRCKMPADGDFRTFEFSAPQGMGGWSGPQ